jgi:deoxycytidine triphosphate deaminase
LQISTKKAVCDGFITNREDSLIEIDGLEGKSSFDISVREVAHWDGENIKFSADYILRPQETVYLISEQRINVKPGYVAYVFLKNRLSQKGILALNTGIIDGGFNGPISTLITNLSKNNVPLSEIDFFRVVFHKIDMINEEDKVISTSYTYDNYKKIVLENMLKLPQHFLDREGLKKTIDNELSSKALNIGRVDLGIVLAIFGLVFVFLPPLAEIMGDKLLGSEKESRAQIKLLKERLDILDSKVTSINLPVKVALKTVGKKQTED